MLLSRLELRDEHNKYVKFLQLNTRGRELTNKMWVENMDTMNSMYWYVTCDLFC